MKVGIIGSYGGGSIGDEAILKGLLNNLNKSNKDINEVLVYTSNKENTLFAISPTDYKFKLIVVNLNNNKQFVNNNESNKTVKNITKTSVVKIRRFLMKSFPNQTLFFEEKTRKILNKPFYNFKIDKEIDILIFGGGNILMDLYAQWAYFLEEVIDKTKNSKTELVFLGVGAGPINTAKGKEVISYIVQNYFVSTRDEKSFHFLKKMNQKSNQLSVNTDLAFGLASYDNRFSIKKDGVAVTAVPYYAKYYWPVTDQRKYENYCFNMARILDEFVEKTSEQLTFFATNYPADLNVANDIIKKMKRSDSVLINNSKMNVDQLMDFCINKRFVIGSRLHSLIISSCVGTNFFAVNYQPKVNYFLEQIGKKKHFIDIKKLEKNMKDTEIKDTSAMIFNEYNNDKIPDFAKKNRNKLLDELNSIL